MADNPSDYYGYLLRLWRSGPNHPWCASLEDVETGVSVRFGSLSEAYEYMLTRTLVSSEAPGSGKPPQASEDV